MEQEIEQLKRNFDAGLYLEPNDQRKLFSHISTLESVLKQRDGGDHDADCKIHRYPSRGCTCGHDMVVDILKTCQPDGVPK